MLDYIVCAVVLIVALVAVGIVAVQGRRVDRRWGR